MLELKHGDVIQFARPATLGNEARAVEYVYANAIRGYDALARSTALHEQSETSPADPNGPAQHCVSCQCKPKLMTATARRHKSTSSCSTNRRSSERKKRQAATDSDASNTASDAASSVKLPSIQGSAIHPKLHSQRFMRTESSGNRRRLCEMRANGPIMKAQRSVDVATLDAANESE